MGPCCMCGAFIWIHWLAALIRAAATRRTDRLSSGEDDAAQLVAPRERSMFALLTFLGPVSRATLEAGATALGTMKQTAALELGVWLETMVVDVAVAYAERSLGPEIRHAVEQLGANDHLQFGEQQPSLEVQRRLGELCKPEWIVKRQIR